MDNEKVMRVEAALETWRQAFEIRRRHPHQPQAKNHEHATLQHLIDAVEAARDS